LASGFLASDASRHPRLYKLDGATLGCKASLQSARVKLPTSRKGGKASGKFLELTKRFPPLLYGEVVGGDV
jgi:hypothetical protein